MWIYYYNAKELEITTYIALNKLQLALKKSEEAYDFAIKNNISYGKGASARFLGVACKSMDRYPEARVHIEEAIEILRNENNVTLLLYSYTSLFQILVGLNLYDDALKTIMEGRQIAEQHNITMNEKGLNSDDFIDESYFDREFAEVYTQMGNKEMALHYFDKINQRIDEYSDLQKASIKSALLDFYEMNGEYEKALQYAEESYNFRSNIQDNLGAFSILEDKARLLYKLNRGMESAKLYQEVLVGNDSLRNVEFALQLDDLRTIYEVDKIEHEKEQAKNYLRMAIVCCIFLI